MSSFCVAKADETRLFKGDAQYLHNAIRCNFKNICSWPHNTVIIEHIVFTSLRRLGRLEGRCWGIVVLHVVRAAPSLLQPPSCAVSTYWPPAQECGQWTGKWTEHLIWSEQSFFDINAFHVSGSSCSSVFICARWSGIRCGWLRNMCGWRVCVWLEGMCGWSVWAVVRQLDCVDGYGVWVVAESVWLEGYGWSHGCI